MTKLHGPSTPVLGGLQGLFEAVAKGKRRPWLHALTRAVGSSAAMNEHRLVERARANARNESRSKQAADILNTMIDIAEASKAEKSAGKLSQETYYERVVVEWNEFVAQYGRAPDRVSIHVGVWQAMSPGERQVLADAAKRDGVSLQIVPRDPLAFWDPR